MVKPKILMARILVMALLAPAARTVSKALEQDLEIPMERAQHTVSQAQVQDTATTTERVEHTVSQALVQDMATLTRLLLADIRPTLRKSLILASTRIVAEPMVTPKVLAIAATTLMGLRRRQALYMELRELTVVTEALG
jgi:hypothetical protein